MNYELKITFEDWWKDSRRRKEVNCPLCKKKLKMSSIYSHFSKFLCKKLGEYEPEERIKVSKLFLTTKSRKAVRENISDERHQLSSFEILASKILQIENYLYNPHLEFWCKLIDGTYNWVTASDLSKSKVGRNLVRKSYRKMIQRFFYF